MGAEFRLIVIREFIAELIALKQRWMMEQLMNDDPFGRGVIFGKKMCARELTDLMVRLSEILRDEEID